MLSDSVRALRAKFDEYSATGIVFEVEACRVMSALLGQWERRVAEMEARSQRLTARDLGGNVILFPKVPKSRPPQPPLEGSAAW